MALYDIRRRRNMSLSPCRLERRCSAWPGWWRSSACCCGKVSAAFPRRLHPDDAAARLAGGLLNPIVGSLVLTGIAVLIGTPLGILAGTYMAEYGRYAKLTTIVRFINDILLSAPSIVVGLFIYEIMVARMGHFSGWAGAVALAVIVVPVVVRTTEDMLTLVPDTLREAAASIGLPRSLMIQKVAYRAARAGMVTGVLLAVARISARPRLYCSPR